MNKGILLHEKMLSYNFGENHVMSTNRILAAYYLLEELFLQEVENNFSRIIYNQFDKKYLYQAHDESYVSTLEKLSSKGSGVVPKYGLGTPDCPVWKGMAEVSEFVVGSSLTLAEKIFDDELNVGFGLLGGLHHASTSMASGFCYYNDINVAIYRLKAMNPDIKILYLDTDLHHGDGVQSTFYTDPNVLTISLHESGQFLFPGTGYPHELGDGKGKGSSINLPFYPYTWDNAYQKSFDALLPPLFESFEPDFVIWQAGSDAHVTDPLGHMMLTSNTYFHMGQKVKNLVEDTMETPKILTLGGGGYNSYGNAKSWSNMLAGLTNVSIPATASESWLNICKEKNIFVNKTLKEPKSSPIMSEKDNIVSGNRNYWDQLVEAIVPFYTI